MKFTLKTWYYRQPTYEFNLPAGWTCPFSSACRIKVDRNTGKMNILGKWYRCYAASAERFPWVREMRWDNYDYVLSWKKVIIPKDATHIRIHASGDFFSQDYFDMWLEVCRENPKVKFWAFTKSIQYWLNRINEVPPNLTIQASIWSKQDGLIWAYKLKFAMVVKSKKQAKKLWMPIDTDDFLAQQGDESFALVDNFATSLKEVWI